MRFLIRNWFGDRLAFNRDYEALMRELSKLSYIQCQEFYVKFGNYHYEYLIDVEPQCLVDVLKVIGKEYCEPVTIVYNRFRMNDIEDKYRLNLFACYPEFTLFIGHQPADYDDDDWDEWFS